MTIAESLIIAARELRAGGVAQPERESASLLVFVLGRDRTFLIAHNDYELTPSETTYYADVIERRKRREPFQHIVGKQEFYGLDFVVSPDVLIPRPETELLVETAIETLAGTENARICEIGTGSGCIVVSILDKLRTATAVAVDISEAALTIARSNAEINGVADRVKFQLSDIFNALDQQKFDVIVSNPPYIPAGDIAELQSEVRDFDPLTALTDGFDGLSIIRRIIGDAPRFLDKNGSLLLEIGFGQAAAVDEMFIRDMWCEPEFLNDLQGIARVVRAAVK